MTSVLEAMMRLDIWDIDVYDSDYDVEGCAWVLSEPGYRSSDTPYYDETAEFLAGSIQFDRLHENGRVPSMTAHIGRFVEQNYDAFREFTADCRMSMTGTDHDDDIMIGISTVNGLIAGYFSEKDYKRFLKLMGVGTRGVRSANRRRKG